MIGSTPAAPDPASHFCGDGHGRAIVDVIHLSAPSPAARLFRLLTLRLHIRLACRRLRQQGARDIRAYAFFPDLDSPTVIYELRSMSQRYAEAHLLWAGDAVPALARGLVTAVAGCAPGAGAVAVVGVRQ
jgi:hypothetical protein